MRYFKRPEPVEAFRLTEESWDKPTTWPDWLAAAYDTQLYEPGAFYGDDGEPCLCIGDRRVKVPFGSYIVRDSGGGLSICPADDFDSLYVPAVPV